MEEKDKNLEDQWPIVSGRFYTSGGQDLKINWIS